MNKIIQEKNDFINDLKSKKENIIKTINDINNNINNINIQNNNKEEEKNVNICYAFSFFYFRFFSTKKAELSRLQKKKKIIIEK